MRFVYKFRKGIDIFLRDLNYHWTNITSRGWRTNEVVNGVLTRDGYSVAGGDIECLTTDRYFSGVLISANVFMYILKIKPLEG